MDKDEFLRVVSLILTDLSLRRAGMEHHDKSYAQGYLAATRATFWAVESYLSEHADSDEVDALLAKLYKDENTWLKETLG